MPGDSFERAWYAYPNITAVELAINTTLIEADEMPANADQVNARKATLDGFAFNRSTKAGIYRGRLSNIYQCEAPLPHMASCSMNPALRIWKASPTSVTEILAKLCFGPFLGRTRRACTPHISPT